MKLNFKTEEEHDSYYEKLIKDFQDDTGIRFSGINPYTIAFFDKQKCVTDEDYRNRRLRAEALMVHTRKNIYAYFGEELAQKVIEFWELHD